MALVKPRIPGFQDGGNAVEPTTGNDVPVGSLPNEVADDIPAKLSEGEFILPADVVRFIGLERLMKMRDEAKEGLRRMAEIGQMGNAEEVGERSDDSFEENDDEFESNIDSIMAEMEKPENEQTERMMAVGGYMSGTDINRAPKNPVFDVRFLRHADGRVMYITYIGGRPMTPIPEGFKEVTREEAIKSASEADASKKAAEEAKKTGSSGGGDGGYSGDGPSVSDTPVGGGADLDAIAKGDLSSLATGTTVSPTAVKGAGVVGTILSIPGAAALVGGKASQNIAAGITNLSGSLAGQQNITDVGKAFGIDTSTQEGKDQVSSLMQQMSENDVTGVPGGTSVQSDAMAAGTAASQAVSAAGGSTQDAAAAQQDAVNAVLSGQDPAAATQAAIDAAIGLSYGGPSDSISGTGGNIGDASTGGSTVGVDALGGDPGQSVSVTGSDGGGGGGGGGGCFLTTAAVEHMNEKDDGEVLSTLREFRDTYMKRNKEASKDVKWYYENAPKIVKELDDLPDAKMVYKRMYNQFIKPAYKAIKAGDDEKAYDIYKKGIKYAKEKADVDNVKPRYTNKKGLASR